MCGYMRGSASFKDSVEQVYTGARRIFTQAEMSSGEFSLQSTSQDDDVFVRRLVASEVRGLGELYCSTICDHRGWAIESVLHSQNDKGFRKELPSIPATVSKRSKNVARLVALGDAEDAKKVSIAHAAYISVKNVNFCVCF